jgi:hypothetical protein
MEEFVTEIQNNISQFPIVEKKTSRIRDFLSYIISSKPEIKIIKKCDEEGDVQFEVPMKSLGISYETLLKYKSEISTDFMANVIGEILIRENMDKFVKMLTDLKDDYETVVNRYEHRKFGLKIFRDRFILSFHISLVRSILVEDFKKNIK